ncbi:MAG: DUF4301 family protein [Flavobacteriales bacterium]|nr:DUF4301 family protein [Flavobacteriales bacterium]
MEEIFKQVNNQLLKIVFYGPESTGKTTLAKQLAAHFQTEWVPEYAREFLQLKWDKTNQICTIEDLKAIAVGHLKAENEAVAKANQWLFLDTDALVTKTYSEMYYGYAESWLEDAVEQLHYDFYFLTDVDVPWEADDLRDKPNERSESFAFFKQKLEENSKPYVVLSGNQEKRFEKALQWLEKVKVAKEIGLNGNQLLELEAHGVSVFYIKEHFQYIQRGIHPAHLVKPATINDGIHPLNEEEAHFYAQFYKENLQKLKVKKFIPASGAASRMFQFLIEFIRDFKLGQETINAYINRSNNQQLSIFLIGKEKFPFYQDLLQHTSQVVENFALLDKDFKDFYLIKELLYAPQFNYINKPKAVLPFHQYPTHFATPLEEHLVEATVYATNQDRSFLHFTITQDHEQLFKEVANEWKPKLERDTQTHITIRYTYQEKSTDTIAFGKDWKPLTDEVGKLIFRPSGHGALLQNLNQLDADVVFIKNIDNVSHNHKQQEMLYKKALAGILLYWQQKIFHYINQLKAVEVSVQVIKEAESFITQQLQIALAEDFFKYTKEYKIDHLLERLNRPIRVCGMVKNEGEPGGGPFWVMDQKGNTSLQIVEKAQVDLTKINQKEVLEASTHFNPVDLVCGMKNYAGIPFNLNEFTNPNAGFVVEKSKNGKTLLAYELPGLWNGSMANWISIFVEIPLSIFNPVKTVNDLLKPAHQPS